MSLNNVNKQSPTKSSDDTQLKLSLNRILPKLVVTFATVTCRDFIQDLTHLQNHIPCTPMTIKIINKFTNKLKNAESEAEAFRAKHLLQ